jgi:nucleoside 2-deoxyribosyltransferase
MNSIPKTPPSVYLAGKIYSNDWRHKLVPGLKHACDRTPINVWSLELDKFTYTGPFFIRDEHGGTHGGGCHGNCKGQSGWTPITKPQLFRRNNHAIESADFIFVYIDAYDCIGTICEVTYAWCLGKPIFLVFSPKIDQAEFWYPVQMVKETYTATEDELPALFETILSAWSVLK